MTLERPLLLASLLVTLAPTAQAKDVLSPWMTDPGGHPHPEYPKDKFYCDVGTSMNNRDEARASAVASVGRQVRSEVTSTATVALQRQIDSDGVVVGGGSDSSSNVTIESYFGRSDLIKYVSEETLKKEYYAYACLDLARAVSSLSNDMAPSLAKFTAYQGQAQDAWSTKDVAGFTPSYRAAMVAYQDVAITASIVHTLSSGTSEKAALVTDGVSWLSSTRAEAVAGVRMALVVNGEGLSSAHKKSISEQVQTNLSDYGFVVGGRCEASASNVWAVEVDVEAPAKYTSMGRYNVYPKLEISLRDCSRTDEPITGLIESPDFKGMSQKEDVAIENALKTVTAERIGPGLLALLEPIFPLEG